MPEQSRDRGEVLAGVEDVRGDGVAQDAGRDAAEAGALSVLAYDQLDRQGLQRLAALPNEDVVVGGLRPDREISIPAQAAKAGNEGPNLFSRSDSGGGI